jgi:RNA polymerase sigma-70 factor (ECF subfamily)
MTSTSNFAKSLDRATPSVDWDIVYAAEMPRVFNFFRYSVGNDMLAEDLTAETFRKAWQNRNKYDHNRGAFSTWLFSIARRSAIDYFRARKPELPIESLSHVSANDLSEATIQQQEELMRLTTILNQYPVREREIIALKFGAGCSNKEIAIQTGISETNVSTLLHRILQKIREAWEVNE